jgi:predicted metalloprotease with PDZ domain
MACFYEEEMMIRTFHIGVFCMILGITLFPLTGPARAQASFGPIRVDVNETQAPQKILHAHLQMPVQPGPLELYYPEWIPGEHMPDGPIIDMAGLKFMGAGKTIPWRRDLIDMFAFHLDIPQGVSTLDIDLDFLLSAPAEGYSSGASATAFLNLVSWNQVVLYPKGYDAANINCLPTLKLPSGWKFGTALPGAKDNDDTIEFAPVSLETLIDSPVITGRYFRTIPLTPGQTPSHEIDIAADSEADLAMTSETQEHFRQLIAEAGALFGSRHYRDYHFLLTLSDNVAHFGLEHHESSDDRTREHSLTDEATRIDFAGLLPHEYVHSWNGKYRRPEDLLTPDYHQPMKDDLLWVYEGLTEYLGSEVLTVRSGLWNQQQGREELARIAATLDNEPGRRWRPLQDTADSAVFLYNADVDWQNWRRSTDFYEEGVYLWLDVDDTIRRLTNDKKSMNDFCRLFYGGPSGEPDLEPYTFEDLVAALNRIAPYDWASFLRSRLDSLAPNTMDESLENSGWKLIYNDQPNEMQENHDAVRREINLGLSIGLHLADDGTVEDVIYDGPSYKAGMGPAMRITAVSGKQFSAETIKNAVEAARSTTAPIQLIVANGAAVQTYSVDYHGGLRYAHLVRDENHPDFLSEILHSQAR